MKTAWYASKNLKTFLLIIAFLVSLLLGGIRYITGPEFAFSLFFLFPILMVTWFIGRWAGIIISIISAVIWLLVDLMAIDAFSNPAIPYINQILRLIVFLVIAFLLSSLKHALEHEKKLAMTDFLTGIPNRRNFFQLAGMEIKRALRYQYPITVILMDIDNFKYINDYFGHQVGDNLLCMVADTLKKNIRATDLVSRIGGDEFIILLPETGNRPAQDIISKLYKELLGIAQNNGWPVTFSFGVISFNRPPNSVDEIINKADTLLYSAKQEGKNMIKQEEVSL